MAVPRPVSGRSNTSFGTNRGTSNPLRLPEKVKGAVTETSVGSSAPVGVGSVTTSPARWSSPPNSRKTWQGADVHHHDRWHAPDRRRYADSLSNAPRRATQLLLSA